MPSQAREQGSALLDRLAQYHAATCDMEFDSRRGLAALVFPDGHAAVAEELGGLLGTGAVPREQWYTAAAVLAAVQIPGTVTRVDAWLHLLGAGASGEAELVRVCETAAARFAPLARRHLLTRLLTAALPLQLPMPARVRLAGCLVGNDIGAEGPDAEVPSRQLLALAGDALELGDEPARRALAQGLLPAMFGRQGCRAETAAWLSTLCRRDEVLPLASLGMRRVSASNPTQTYHPSPPCPQTLTTPPRLQRAPGVGRAGRPGAGPGAPRAVCQQPGRCGRRVRGPARALGCHPRLPGAFGAWRCRRLWVCRATTAPSPACEAGLSGSATPPARGPPPHPRANTPPRLAQDDREAVNRKRAQHVLALLGPERLGMSPRAWAVFESLLGVTDEYALHLFEVSRSAAMCVEG